MGERWSIDELLRELAIMRALEDGKKFKQAWVSYLCVRISGRVKGRKQVASES